MTTEKTERVRQEIAEMHEGGLTAEQIAQELGLSVQTVRHHMNELAIQTEPLGWANANKFLGNIIQDYQLGVPIAEIVRKYETTVYSVTKILIQEGVFAAGQAARKRERENRERLIVDAYNQGMRVLDIATNLQVSQAHIYVVLARRGIKPSRRGLVLTSEASRLSDTEDSDDNFRT